MADRSDALGLTRRAALAAPALLIPFSAEAAPPSAEAVRRAVGAPAAGVAWSRGGGRSMDVSGRRAEGHDAEATSNDLWHLGSLTKSMTAMLAFRMIETGQLASTDTLGARLGALAGSAAGTDLMSLLHHRSGIEANPPMATLQALRKDAETDPVAARRRFLEEALTEPGYPPGRFLYSNTGYVAAAAMMEAATGRPWEAMIQDEVFAPLGLASAGFGPPGASVSSPDQPWGHHRADGATQAHAPTDAADNILAMNPAGRVHMSLGDFLTYMTAHATRPPILSDQSWSALHEPAKGGGRRYAAGWAAPSRRIRMHSGSNTIWFATGGFNTQGDAVAVVTNIGQGANLPGPVERPALEFLDV